MRNRPTTSSSGPAQSGHRIRITGQLIEAESGAHLWAERYDRALDDVFAIQDEITESVIGCIQPHVYAAEHERLKRKPPKRLDAWESFVRAMFLYSQHSEPSTREALVLVDRAVELDPGYAQAHGLRAVCLAWRAIQGWEHRATAFTQAAASADRAVAGDPGEPWAHLARGFIAIARMRDAETTDAFSRAIEVSPNFAYAHGLLGAAHAFRRTARPGHRVHRSGRAPEPPGHLRRRVSALLRVRPLSGRPLC